MDLEHFTRINVERVLHVVEAADVLAVGFALFPQRLLVDMRYTEQDPPMIKVVQPVSSVEDRIKELQKTRPHFSIPEHFFFFVWPRRIGAFESLGVWPRIVQRCLDSGHAQIAGDCNVALERLYQLERAEFQEAIMGSKYRTLWEHPR